MTVKEISPLELTNLSIKNLRLIDVREVDEFEEVAAKGALNFPLSSFKPTEVAKALNLNKNEDIYVICKAGGRSMRAAQMLEQEGYTNVFNVTGGTMQWEEDGCPLS